MDKKAEKKDRRPRRREGDKMEQEAAKMEKKAEKEGREERDREEVRAATLRRLLVSEPLAGVLLAGAAAGQALRLGQRLLR